MKKKKKKTDVGFTLIFKKGLVEILFLWISRLTSSVYGFSSQKLLQVTNCIWSKNLIWFFLFWFKAAIAFQEKANKYLKNKFYLSKMFFGICMVYANGIHFRGSYSMLSYWKIFKKKKKKTKVFDLFVAVQDMLRKVCFLMTTFNVFPVYAFLKQKLLHQLNSPWSKNLIWFVLFWYKAALAFQKKANNNVNNKFYFTKVLFRSCMVNADGIHTWNDMNIGGWVKI